MMRLIIFPLLLFVGLFPLHLIAQEKNPYEKVEPEVQLKGKLEGVREPKLIDQLMLVMPGFDSGVRDMLMEQSVKNFMMPPRTLGKRGSEMSYTVASCLEFYTNFGHNYKVNLSPDYISLSIPKKHTEQSIQDGFNFLAQTGTVSAAIMPYDASAISTAVYATEKYMIDNFLHVIHLQTPRRQKVFEVRKALMRGNPMVIELLGDSRFAQFKNEKNWKGKTVNSEEAQSFPLIVVGFDQTREAIEVMNAWSPSWGQNGYAWISYDDFGKYVQNGFVLLPKTKPQ